MFSMKQISETFGDCTAKYSVTLDKEYTLQEFIDTVLAEKNDEWGNICIVKRDCAWYNYPKIEYRYGKIIKEGNIPEKVYSYKIKSVSAHGGWTAMDYLITLEKEVE